MCMRSSCFSTIPIQSWITKSIARSRTSATFSVLPAFKKSLNIQHRYTPVGSQQLALAYGNFYTAWDHPSWRRYLCGNKRYRGYLLTPSLINRADNHHNPTSVQNGTAGGRNLVILFRWREANWRTNRSYSFLVQSALPPSASTVRCIQVWVGATNHMRSGNIRRSKPSNKMEWSFVSQLPLAHGVLNVVLSARQT